MKHETNRNYPRSSIFRALSRHIRVLVAPVLASMCLVGLHGATQPYNIGGDGVALKGYDRVGYFSANQALKGSKQISAQHRGVTYWFASEENRKLFVESPGKFLPTYGGWCATAMAKGEKVEIDPTNFKVTQGRLFLFYKGLWGNARKEWDKDEPGLTAKADANWKKIAGE